MILARNPLHESSPTNRGAYNMGAERVPVAGKLSQARDTMRGVMTVARREAAARHGAGPVRDRDSRDG